MSQKDAILAALQAGDRLTPLIALQRFQCFTLSQRVTELRAEGYNIRSTLIPNQPGGRKRIAEYWIDQPIGEQHAETANAGFSHAAGQA